jgi:hypothetical protein
MSDLSATTYYSSATTDHRNPLSAPQPTSVMIAV